MSEANPRTESLFWSALAISSPEERARYLDQSCGGDQPLRGRIDELLAAYPKVEGFLEPPVATVDESPSSERPGTVIGPYKLLQQIGEGGMGTVFMAEQMHPVQRKVALKLIKSGMDSRQVIARFEAERQALAMMDHVNIARVFEAGATEAGRPYFVMELVHGVPITKYCDDNRLTPRERLELFVPVCQAIQHAHQKGIIHRDIKPSNVMITLYDGKPVPKVIDFGVAKATEQHLTERTLFTQYGALVGTLEYMSPEQAEMSALGVDTRCDIFSLGVLLYELLTGGTPLSHKRVREAAYGEVLRMIKEEEAPRPSTRLNDSGEALASISAQRHMEPAKLARLMRGELDWIVMKTLEKDRNRRYETVNGFAADVLRYLNDETVQACPPSAWYRFKKLLRRHKGLVLAAVVLFVAVTAVTSVAAALLYDEQQATKEQLFQTQLAEGDAQRARDEEARQKTEVTKERDSFQQLLYVANMRLAHNSWEGAEITRMKELLDLYLPRPGQPDLRGWEWYYLYSLCHNHALTLEGHTKAINAVAWSPDGRWLTSAGSDGLVKVWEATTGKERLVFPGHKGEVHFAAWSPDGKRVASMGPNQNMKVWDAATGKELFSPKSKSVSQLAWFPDSQRLLVLAHGKGVKKIFFVGLEVWDAATGKELQSLPLPKEFDHIRCWALSPDGVQLAYFHYDGRTKKTNWGIQVWDLQQGKSICLFSTAPNVTQLAWSSDGKRLAAANANGSVTIWETATSKEIQRLHGQGAVLAVAWSRDDKRLACAGAGRVIHIWDPHTGKKIYSFYGHAGDILSLSWNPDGSTLASAGGDRTVKVWQVKSQSFSLGLSGTALCWHAAAKQLCVGHADGLVSFPDWDTGKVSGQLADQELLQKLLPPKKYPNYPDEWGITSLAMSPDQGRLAVCRREGYVEIWKLKPAPQRIRLWKVNGMHTNAPGGLLWNPVSEHLLTFGAVNQVKVWDTVTGKELHALDFNYPVRAAAWSPDGRRLATIDEDGAPVIWDGITGQELQRLLLLGSKALAWSPNSRRLAIAQDTAIQIWHLENRTLEFHLHGHHGEVLALAWSQDGRRLASAGVDDTVRVWDLPSKQEILKLHAPSVRGGVSLSWCPERRRLAIVTAKGVQTWNPNWAYQQHPPQTTTGPADH